MIILSSTGVTQLCFKPFEEGLHEKIEINYNDKCYLVHEEVDTDEEVYEDDADRFQLYVGDNCIGILTSATGKYNLGEELEEISNWRSSDILQYHRGNKNNVDQDLKILKVSIAYHYTSELLPDELTLYVTETYKSKP